MCVTKSKLFKIIYQLQVKNCFSSCNNITSADRLTAVIFFRLEQRLWEFRPTGYTNVTLYAPWVTQMSL
jgi:hypothetical protein